VSQGENHSRRDGWTRMNKVARECGVKEGMIVGCCTYRNILCYLHPNVCIQPEVVYPVLYSAADEKVRISY
jgi:hypothetical protein